MVTAINVKRYMHDGWFIPVPIKVGIIHVLGLLSTLARLMMFATKRYGRVKKLAPAATAHLDINEENFSPYTTT